MLFSRFSDNSGIKTISKKRPPSARTSASETDGRPGQIIRVLMQYPTVVISGTKLAQEIGTTRSEVWRLVQQLRTLGVAIAGHPASGYQLTAVPDLLLPELLEPLLRGTIFAGHVHHYYRAGSTNTLAMQAAAEGAPEGSVFLAEQQTAGRGRGSNQWHSAESSGIYCSVILRPPLPPSEALPLSLAAGLAVKTAIEEFALPTTIDLKWPNDVLLGRRKVCGILIEMSAEATRVRYLVVGIGVNVNQPGFPEELAEKAVSLRMVTGSEWSRLELCAALLRALEREYGKLAANPETARGEVLQRFEASSSSVRGYQVRIEENGGGFEGTTDGLDPNGFLRVRTAEGARIVYSGTVRLG